MLVIIHHFAVHFSSIKSEVYSKQSFKLCCSYSTTIKAEINYQLGRDLHFFSAIIQETLEYIKYAVFSEPLNENQK